MSKRIVILGAGESGTGAALLAATNGYEVFVSDFGEIKADFKKDLSEKNILFEEKGHSLDLILNASTIIKSPGISEKTEVMKKVREAGIEVISEIEFASRFTNARFIAITGTNGKTTTTLLIWHILKNAGFDAGLAGNIGMSLARQVLNDGTSGKAFYVVELSSFQLDDVSEFRAHVAVLLNITPDHLDRYNYDFSLYKNAKFKITNNQINEDTFIFWEDDQEIREEIVKRNLVARSINISLADRKAYAFSGEKVLNVDGYEFPVDNLPLKGRHNQINIMAAVSVAKFLGAKQDDIRAALSTYKNVPHRMEFAGEIEGILFINDSKATNVDSVFYALDAYKASITWIAGGIDKGNNYDQIRPLVLEKVKTLICLGTDNSKLKDYFGELLGNVLETKDIQEAARMAFEYSEKSDVVLLSPACASFDLFKNYEDRGEQFKQSVSQLKIEMEAKTI